MNLLSIYLTQSCNLGCYYCPMKEWMKPLDYVFEKNGINPGEAAGAKFNSITNEALLRWTDAYCPPSEWLLHITGGEPGLYPEIGTLIPALTERGYKGVISTNGTLPIPASPNFIRAAAWHEGVAEMPPYHDVILLLEPNPNDDTEEKKQYCEEHGVPYKTKLFVPFHDPCRGPTPGHVPENVRMKKVCRILSMGQLTRCHSSGPVWDKNIWNMTPPLLAGLAGLCRRCGNVRDVERFMPPEWF